MSNEESGQPRQQDPQAGQPPQRPWGQPEGEQPGAQGQREQPAPGGQQNPPTSTWPTSPGGGAPHGGGQQYGPGPQGAPAQHSGPGQHASPGQQSAPGQQSGRPPGRAQGQSPSQPQPQGQGQPWGPPAYGQSAPQGQQAQPGQQTQGVQGQQGGFAGPGGAPAAPKAPSSMDSGTVVRLVLHALALLLVVLGISIPMDDMGVLWGDSAAWAGFATVAALAQGAPLLGKTALGGNAWMVGAAGAAGLLLFWTLLMLPMIQTNMAFMVTVGTACAAVAVTLSPDRRL